MESVLDISAHKYGNYHKYYTFHPSSARICFFNTGSVFLKLWEAQNRPAVFTILDIGCNEGNLSVDVLEQAKKELPSDVQCVLLGVDLDSSLIELANTKYITEADQFKEFHALNFMDVAASKSFVESYTNRLKSLLGSRTFEGFSVVCLFSITMWIHLNYGDDGLKDFLLRSAALLSPLGSLVVEPQPWKCYKAADKRCRKLGITRPLHYSALTIRNIEVDTADIVLQRGQYAPSGPSAPSVESTVAAATQSASTPEIPRALAGDSFQMKSHWDLGKEGWGRSILIFHRSEHIASLKVGGASTGGAELVQDSTVKDDDGDDSAGVAKKAKIVHDEVI